MKIQPIQMVSGDLTESLMAQQLIDPVAAMKIQALGDRLAAQMASVSQQIANIVRPLEFVQMDLVKWSATLEAQMKSVSSAWIRPEIPSFSFEGFATVSRLAQITHRASQPFDDRVREIIDEDLGDAIDVSYNTTPNVQDEAHVHSGMNPSILAVSSDGIDGVLLEVGFGFHLRSLPIPNVGPDDMSHDLSFNPRYNELITHVECRLRLHVNQIMTEAYGSRWVEKRIDKEVSRTWGNVRDAAVRKGEKPLDLIHYTNFMELKDIVVKGGHWKYFEATFVRKDHFTVSMERLHSIRLPLSHSRPLGTGHIVQLVTEASIIFKALGLDMFEKPFH